MKFKLLSLYLIAILTIFGVISASRANAQTSMDILVNVVPPNPAPYENTKITLNSFADNLDSVLISWSVNGKESASGTGDKSFSVTAPALGVETMVVATVHLPSGAVEMKIPIRASVMVLLWQADDSYVPPFYRGKALPASDSEIKIVAMPEIKTGNGLADPKNMTYAWKKDYTNNVDGSGYGKNYFVYTNNYLEDSNNISVAVSTVDQQYSSQGSIDVGIAQPKILFYKNDATLGTLWNMALADTYKINGSEIVEAAPYFLSPKELQNPTIVWSWFINDNPVNLTGFQKNLMPLQVSEGTHGTSKLRLDIASQAKILETASKEINITF